VRVVYSGYEGKLGGLQRWELDRLLVACEATIAHYRRTLRDEIGKDRAELLKGQIKAEFAWREPGVRFLYS